MALGVDQSRKAWALLLFAICAAALQLQGSMADVHKVGDSAGWTTIGNIDYKQWSATKSFQLGDVIGMSSILPLPPKSAYTNLYDVNIFVFGLRCVRFARTRIPSR